MFGARKATGRQLPLRRCIGPCATLRGSPAVPARAVPQTRFAQTSGTGAQARNPGRLRSSATQKAQRQLPARGFEGLVSGKANTACAREPRKQTSAVQLACGTRIRIPNTRPRPVDWVSRRRLHSPLLQSRHVNHRVDEPTSACQPQPPASVSRRMDARSAGHPSL